MYALNLAEDKRILSITYDRFAPASQPRVDHLPEGDVTDYKFFDGDYVYDPIPIPPEPDPEPTRMDQIEAQGLYTALMTDTLIN